MGLRTVKIRVEVDKTRKEVDDKTFKEKLEKLIKGSSYYSGGFSITIKEVV
jgi:hypothetical protein